MSIFFGCSCTKEDTISLEKEGTIVVQKPYLWWNKEEEHGQSIVTKNLIFNKSFIAETHQNGKSFLSLQQCIDGKILWKWNDYINNDIAIRSSYFYKNLFIFQSGPRTYCIDLLNGKTKWKKTWENSFNKIESGYDDFCFLLQYYANDNSDFPGYYKIDINTGNISEKNIPKFENYKAKNVLGQLGLVSSVDPIKSNDVNYLLITYAEPVDLYSYNSFISLYNDNEKKWIYEYNQISDYQGVDGAKIVDDKIYYDKGHSIFCYNYLTKDSLWNVEFKGGFLFGGYIYDNGTLYCAAETDGYYALDAETGDIKWKGERSPGTSSHMAILNGVLYYINGADGRLWALDAATGKTLWRLKSPDNFGFKREINVMPGDGIRKGYVLTSTWHGACAYEAER